MAAVVIEIVGTESVNLHKHFGNYDLRIDRGITLQIDGEKTYQRFRESMAEALGLIVPEKAAEPEQIAATATGMRKTAVAAAV